GGGLVIDTTARGRGDGGGGEVSRGQPRPPGHLAPDVRGEGARRAAPAGMSRDRRAAAATAGRGAGLASAGARSVFRKAINASWSPAGRLRDAAGTFRASWPCRRTASRGVAQPPSWEYGAQSAPPHTPPPFPPPAPPPSP